jgi:hypothetical protein
MGLAIIKASIEKSEAILNFQVMKQISETN